MGNPIVPGTGEADPAAAAAAAAAAGTGTAWHDGYDAETKAFIEAKQYHLKPKDEAFTLALKGHQNAERLIGQDHIRVPQAGDTEAWKAVYTKLGVPTDPTQYDFAEVKFTDGSDPDQSFIDFSRKLATDLHLPKEAAPQLAREIVKYVESANTTEASEAAAKLALAKDALDKNWGPAKESNMFIAKNAAMKLGFSKEAVDALEASAGYDKVMEMFRQLGVRMGEDRYLGPDNPGLNANMTFDTAQARKSELMADTAWRDRFLAGGSAEKSEMEQLDRTISAQRNNYR